jgi:hypothetical protein
MCDLSLLIGESDRNFRVTVVQPPPFSKNLFKVWFVGFSGKWSETPLMAWRAFRAAAAVTAIGHSPATAGAPLKETRQRPHGRVHCMVRAAVLLSEAARSSLFP